ncbi:VWA domain-containing protein [Hylemonella gracilis]|uniref:VWA domain-containing protein n=1 Tax=Hylemonella gracilis TaxID=80880 RepID=A0A4P6UJD5_9BURK|nr:VWA domain-containing protein [Hylemonella gracilis]
MPRLLLRALSLRGLAVQHLPTDASSAAQPPPPSSTRPILTPMHLLLPALTPALQRAAVAHAAAHLLHSVPAQPPNGLRPLAQVVVGAIEDARVEQLLARDLPGVRAWFDAPLRAAWQADGLSFFALLSRLDLALHDERCPDGHHWVNKARSAFDAARRAHGLEDAAAFRRLASILANDLGQMRVRHEPQQLAVPAPYRDDHSHLWTHKRNTEEAQTLPTPEAPPPVGHPACASLPLPPSPKDEAATIPQGGPAIHLYPEWDRRLERLRPDWCTLHEWAPVQVTEPITDAGLERTRLPSRLHSPSRLSVGPVRRLRHQSEGEQLDLDAAIDAVLSRRLQQAHDGRVFQRRAPQQPPCSLLLLLDSSQSTADQDAQGRSLMALEQAAAWQLTRAVLAARGRIAIHAFHSDSRARVHYRRLLDFGQAMDARAQARLEALQPAWSTRLGAALRHATRLLTTEPAERRAVLVLSDGAPSDIDAHDPRDLVEDARQAVREAAQRGLPVYGLIVDPTATAYARRIFGVHRHRILARTAPLHRQLTALHARI